eukprot:1382594-Amorphochlora_amoeboformis.AAC.1
MSSSIHKCMRIKEYFGTQDVFPDILGMETGKPSFVSSGRRGSFSTVYSDPMGQRCLALHMLRTHASENLRFLLKVSTFDMIWFPPCGKELGLAWGLKLNSALIIEV